jgi:hypothetical protein
MNLNPNQYQKQLLDAKPMRELKKGRGTRTTSIKPLSTLIPLITCFDCTNQFNEPEHQLEKKQKKMKLKHVTNYIIVRNKLKLIIQNSKKIHFEVIKKLKKLSSLTKNNHFYENNKLIEDNHIIKKGVHFIHFRSYLKGGSNNIFIKISSTILTTPINNEQNMFDLYRLVATWTCTNVSSFSIQGEDFDGLRRILCHNDTIHKGQFRMLIVKFMPIRHQNDLIVCSL